MRRNGDFREDRTECLKILDLHLFRKYLFVAGYGLFGIASLALVACAAYIYEQREVGILAIVIALQFLLSQLAGIGIHFSALYHGSDTSRSDELSVYSMFNVILCSSTIAFIFSIVFPRICEILYPTDVLEYVSILSIYAVLAASNKVFVAQLNAKQRFDYMGWVFAIKGLVAMAMIVACYFFNPNLKAFILRTILLPEIIIGMLYLAFSVNNLKAFKWSRMVELFVRDVSYGAKALWGALFLDSSTKVDILVLGAYTDARTTGIYTFIALISDLFLQYTTLVRSYFNPKITAKYIDVEKRAFQEFVWQKTISSYLIIAPFIIALALGFALVIWVVPDYSEYLDGLRPMAILAGFLFLVAGFFPLLQLFGQIGQPTKQSATYFILFASNLILNLILIPQLGMDGAALATGMSYMIYALLFTYMVRKIS